MPRRDWLAAVKGAGSTVKISKPLQVKGRSDRRQPTFISAGKRRVRWKCDFFFLHISVRHNSGGDGVFFFRLESGREPDTFSFLEESVAVSTIVWLPGTLCNSEQLGQLRDFNPAINKE